MRNVNEHKFMADFQPWGGVSGFTNLLLEAIGNWFALFGVAYIVGCGLRLGLGL